MFDVRGPDAGVALRLFDGPFDDRMGDDTADNVQVFSARTRPSGSTPARISFTPVRTVFGEAPASRATNSIPPQPIVCASAANSSRHCFSSRNGRTLAVIFGRPLNVEARPPAQALHQAQQWMLDPHRQPPPGMPAELARLCARPDLADPISWAGFTHLGR